MKMLRVASLLVMSAICVPSLSAHAQMDSREGIDLQNQIAELRQELQMMQQAQQSGGPTQQNYPTPQPYDQSQGQPPAGASGGSDTAAQLLVRVSALEEQVRDLQGKVDDLTNQMQRQHDELAKEIGDLSFKLGGGAPSGPGAQPAPDPVAVPQPQKQAPPPPPATRRTPEMSLHEGNAALARHDYAAAEAAAREVLEAGHGPRLIDAQFLLARAEGGQQKYQASAADFYKAYARAPKSPSGQVALLGVANSLIAMNDTKDACEALAKLGAEFPKASPGVKQNATAARKRAGCGR